MQRAAGISATGRPPGRAICKPPGLANGGQEAPRRSRPRTINKVGFSMQWKPLEPAPKPASKHQVAF